MSLKDLFTTLNFLEDNRLLGIEADAKLDPFRDQHYALGLIYDESSRTIGTRFDRAYEQPSSIDSMISATRLAFQLAQ